MENQHGNKTWRKRELINLVESLKDRVGELENQQKVSKLKKLWVSEITSHCKFIWWNVVSNYKWSCLYNWIDAVADTLDGLFNEVFKIKEIENGLKQLGRKKPGRPKKSKAL